MPANWKYYFRREDNQELVFVVGYDEMESKRHWADDNYMPPREYIICDDGVKAWNISGDEERKLNNLQECNVDGTMRENHRWSWAMGVHVKDIPKMMKKHPDRVYNPKTGQLLVKNREHKKKLMKEHDMVEYV